MRIVLMIFIYTLLAVVYILTPSVLATPNNFLRTTIRDEGGTIQSPNFGHEYGERADCNWRFNMREEKVLKLKLTQLKIFYHDENGLKQCGDYYRFSVNKDVVNCTESINSNGGGDTSPKYHHFYSTPSCSEVECRFGCSRLKLDKGFVEVGYYASGNRPIPRLPPVTMWGFRMTYEYLDCPPDEINMNAPTTTTTKVAWTRASTTTATTTTTTTKSPTTTLTTTTTLAPTTTTTSRAPMSTSTTTTTLAQTTTSITATTKLAPTTTPTTTTTTTTLAPVTTTTTTTTSRAPMSTSTTTTTLARTITSITATTKLAPTTTPTTTTTTTTTTLAPVTTTTTTTTSRAPKSTSATTTTTPSPHQHPVKPPPSETKTWRQSDVEVTTAKHQNVTIIYGSIGGGVSFVILLVIAVFCIVRQTRKKRSKDSEETAPVNGDREMTDNVLYGTSGDFDDSRGDASVNPAVVYASIDKGAKKHSNDESDATEDNADIPRNPAPPINKNLMYSSVAVDTSGEKSTVHFEKDD